MPEDVERRLFAANQKIDEVDEALLRLRAALRLVDEAIESAKERGVWSS